MVHIPYYLSALLCVVRPLHSKWGGGEGTVPWGGFPRGCEGTAAPRCLLYPPPPPCISYALVQATVSTGTVWIWYLIVNSFGTKRSAAT